MNKLLAVVIAVVATMTVTFAEAKGGFSSGGSRGGFSSAGRSVSSVPSSPSPSRSTSAPSTPAKSTAPASSYSAPPPATPAAVPRSTTTTTTYSSRNVSSPVQYGAMGPGFGYSNSNGLLTGLIIGNMMHPHNTTVYSGSGTHSNNALLYPDGKVVNKDGQQVGTYTDGAFTAVENGPIVASKVPADAVESNGVGYYLGLMFLILSTVGLLAAIGFFGFNIVKRVRA